MKVLMLAHRVPYPPNKGEKIRTFHHLSHLLKQGHEVTVAVPLDTTEDQKYAEELQKKFSLPVIHSQLSARVGRLARGMLSGQPLSVTNFYSKELQIRINQLVEADKPDVLMCTSSAMAEYIFDDTLAEIIRQHSIRLVMDFMDLDSLKWNQYASRKPWPLSLVYKREAKLLGATETKILETFDASLFVSAEEKKLLTDNAQLQSKVHAVTNGVDTKEFYPGTKEQKSDSSPTLLFTGVMDYFPNEDAVLWFVEHVWPSLILKYPTAKFIVAGMRPSKKIKEIANIQGIEVTGFVEDILPYYQQADFLIASFRVARGIQNKVLQAMACGLPVITSEEGATGINCRHGEHLMIADTANDYIEAIEELLADENLYAKISQTGLDLVNTQYSWDKENLKLEAILQGSTS